MIGGSKEKKEPAKAKPKAVAKTKPPGKPKQQKARRPEAQRIPPAPMRFARILVAIATAVEVIVFIGIGATTKARARLDLNDLIVAGTMVGTTLVQVFVVMLLERRRARRRARKAAAVVATQPAAPAPAPEPAATTPQPAPRSERPLIIDDPKPAGDATAASRTYAPLRAPIPATPAAEPRPLLTAAPKSGPLASRAAARAALLEWSVPDAALSAPQAVVDPTALWTMPASAAPEPAVEPTVAAGPASVLEPTAAVEVAPEPVAIVEGPVAEAPSEDDDLAQMRAGALSLLAPTADTEPIGSIEEPIVDDRLALLGSLLSEEPVVDEVPAVDEVPVVAYEPVGASAVTTEPPVVNEPLSELAGLVRALDALRTTQASEPAPQPVAPAPTLTYEEPTPPSPSRVRVRLDLDLDADGFAALLRALEQGDVVGVPRQPGLTVLHGGRASAAN